MHSARRARRRNRNRIVDLVIAAASMRGARAIARSTPTSGVEFLTFHTLCA